MDEPAFAVDHTILAVDIEGFGDNEKIDPFQVEMRNGVYNAVREALTKSGVPWERCYHEDRGDGLVVLIPRDVPKKLLGAPFPRELAATLQQHNDVCSQHARIRLRAAAHAGQIRRDDHGVAGTAVNLTFRMLNSDVLRSALSGSPGVLAYIVSDWFFQDVIRHDPASTPAAYRRVRVSVKKTRTHGWISLPDHPYRPRRIRPHGRRLALGLAVAHVVIAAAASVAILAWPPIRSDGGTASTTPSTPSQPFTSTMTAPPGVVPTGNQPPPYDWGNRPTGARPGPSTQPSDSTPPSQQPTARTTPQPPPATARSSTPATTNKQRPTDPVQEERTVVLSTYPGQESVEIDWLRQNHDRSGDLQVDSDGMFTVVGARLVVIEDSPEPTRDRCQHVQTWTDRVDFASLHLGSQLCVHSLGDRYGMLQVHALPDSPGSNGRLVVYARTWAVQG